MSKIEIKTKSQLDDSGVEGIETQITELSEALEIPLIIDGNKPDKLAYALKLQGAYSEKFLGNDEKAGEHSDDIKLIASVRLIYKSKLYQPGDELPDFDQRLIDDGHAEKAE